MSIWSDIRFHVLLPKQSKLSFKKMVEEQCNGDEVFFEGYNQSDWNKDYILISVVVSVEMDGVCAANLTQRCIDKLLEAGMMGSQSSVEAKIRFI